MKKKQAKAVRKGSKAPSSKLRASKKPQKARVVEEVEPVNHREYAIW